MVIKISHVMLVFSSSQCSVKPASCPRILLAKWAEFVLAARLLNLAGEPIEAVINLGGMNKVKLNAIAAINGNAAPARLSVGPKAASPSDLED